MARLNPATGMWEDDDSGPAPQEPGSLGMQQDTPETPPFPPPVPTDVAPPPVPPPPPLAAPAPPAPPLAAPPPAEAAPPALPQVEPYQMQAPVRVPAGGVVSPAESATLGQIDQNAAARAATAQQVGQVGQAKADAQSTAAARDEADAIQRQKDQERLVKEGNERILAAQSRQKALYDEHRAMGLKDPEADQSFGHKLLAAIAIGLGEYGSRMSGGGPNRAYELIKAANDQNIALQKEAIEKKFREAQLAGGDVVAAEKAKEESIRDLTTKGAALKDAAAARLKTELSRMGIPEAQIAANETAQRIEGDAESDRQKVEQSIRQDQTRLTERQMELDAKKKARGAGGGGVGGKAEAALEKDVGKRMDKYEAQAVGTARTLGPVRVLSQVEAMRTGLEDAVASGNPDRLKAAVVKAKEQAGSLMSGGKLTNAQIKILHDLESTSDEVEAKIGKWTGSPTEGKGLVGRLTNLIDDAGNELATQVKDIRQRGIDEALGAGGLAKTEAAKQLFLNRNRGLYGQSRWQGKALFEEGGASAPPRAAPSAGEQAAALTWARANRNDPRAKKILAVLGQ